MAALAAAGLAGAQAAYAQLLPAIAPNVLAARLTAHGIDPAGGFRPAGAASCRPDATWAYRCSIGVHDDGRGGHPAAMEVLIARGAYNFAANAESLRRDLAKQEGRAPLMHVSDIRLAGRGIQLHTRPLCFQVLGPRNSPAYCVAQISSNVLIYSQVEPSRRSSNGVTLNMKTGSDSFGDMVHASTLAAVGATAIANAIVTSPRQPKTYTEDIFRKR
ncbi:MAG TPA: hypothetical protein VGF77_17195 [Allosphingosinicella sp.]|jgi:hypothetical protein